MAHNIGEMFYFGETPWHSLGRKLAAPATLDEALATGGLDWTVGAQPIMTDESPPSPIRQRVAIVRSDRDAGAPGRVLGVVHPGFRPLQNRDGAALFDALLGQGGRVYHTGGYLGAGEVVWLLARIPNEIRVSDRDIVEPYLLYTNSHDGSIAIDMRLTTVRVVCQNTLNLALQRGKVGAVFRRAHRGSLEGLREEASAFFAFITQQVQETETRFRRLAAAPCDDPTFAAFLKRLLPDPAVPKTASTNPAVRRAHEARTQTLFEHRSRILVVRREGIADQKIAPEGPTWRGALHAVTAWVDHLQSIRIDRYAHRLFGDGDRIKRVAADQIMTAVK